jgi:photosystem II stability/assembly factor-like uncharacterized protein
MALVGLSLALAAGAGADDWTGGGPEIGWIRTLLQASDGNLYAGTWGGGIFRSADGGTTWTEATTNARDAVVLDLAEGIDPSRTLFAAATDRGLLRKEQTSDFWTQLGRFPDGVRPAGVSIETFPFRDRRIAFGSDNAVFVSNSLGLTWPDTLSFGYGQAATDIVVLPEIPNTVHMLTPLEIVTTSDYGQTENFFRDGLASSTFLLDLEPWSAGTDSLLVADQQGPVWQFIDRQRFIEVGPPERSNKYVCRIDPSNGNRILLGSSVGLWRSEDRLESWSRVEDGMPADGAEIWAIERSRVGENEELRMGSFTLGFIRTGPGGEAPWTVSNSGLTAAWARTVEPAAGGVLCGTAHGRLYRTLDEGQTWEDVTGALRTLQISVSHDTGTAWIVSGYNGVFRSSDGGTSWQRVTLPAGVTRLNQVVRAGSKIIAATNSGIVESADDGSSFTQIAGVPTGRASFALAVDSAGRIAAGLDARFGTGQVNEIWIGSDATGFVPITPPAGFAAALRGIGFASGDLVCGANGDMGSPLFRVTGWGSGQPEFVDLAPQIGDGLFEVRDMSTRANAVAIGTTGDGVFLSIDGGVSWSEWNGGLPTRRIEAVAFTPGPGRALWVATLGRGAFVRPLDPGVPVLVSGLRVEPVADGVRVRLAVHGPSRLRLWRESAGRTVLFEGEVDQDLDLVDRSTNYVSVAWGVDLLTPEGWIEVERVERSVRDLVPPVVSQLLPAVPNPFNPQTTIHFELAVAGRVRVDVYDARGRRVRRLVDHELPAGPHSRSFDGRDDRGGALASGVYFLLLEAPDRRARTRITLVR